jgi:hypothetical protein
MIRYSQAGKFKNVTRLMKRAQTAALLDPLAGRGPTHLVRLEAQKCWAAYFRV